MFGLDVAWIIGLGEEGVPPGNLPLTPRMQTIIELSEAEAEKAGRRVVGTEHLLLGLAREGNGVANVILRSYGLTSDDVRASVMAFIAETGRWPH